MSAVTNMQRQYRSWAYGHPTLALYWQPGWLDIVDPYWRAASDNWDAPGWVWPYALHTRLGRRWIGMPRVTKYLGPKILKPEVQLPALPSTRVKYGVFTLHNPNEVSKYPGKVRAMVGLSLDLTSESSFTPSRARRIRRFTESATAVVDRTSDTDDVAELLRVHADIVPLETDLVMSRACRAGFGEYYVARASDGTALAAIGVVFDTRVAYQIFSVRSERATADTGSALQAFAIQHARIRGLVEFNFQSGHLAGPYQFFRSFGAQPQWYGQVRAATSKTWRLLETVRGLTNSGRI